MGFDGEEAEQKLQNPRRCSMLCACCTLRFAPPVVGESREQMQQLHAVPLKCCAVCAVRCGAVLPKQSCGCCCTRNRASPKRSAFVPLHAIFTTSNSELRLASQRHPSSSLFCLDGSSPRRRTSAICPTVDVRRSNFRFSILSGDLPGRSGVDIAWKKSFRGAPLGRKSASLNRTFPIQTSSTISFLLFLH
jgi:hypothetical protein